MAKKPTIKDCVKFVCDGLDTINDTMINKNKELEEQNKIARERLDWEMSTKDRVDIPLKKYEGMKAHIDHLTRKNYQYEEIFERLRINEIVDKIDPATIVMGTMKDPMRMTTKVTIQFDCNALIEPCEDKWAEMTPFERWAKRVTKK